MALCILILLITLSLAIVGLGLHLWLAPYWELVDTPNARSLHDRPRVVSAGLPVVFAVSAGWFLLPGGPTGGAMWLALIIACLCLIGLLDDRFSLPSVPRLMAYAVLTAIALWRVPEVGGGIAVLLFFASLWLINLFNFMDGADGFAGLQALLTALAMGLFCQFGLAPELAPLWWLLVAGILPFLLLNWPPARCFMGDAGSIPIGFMLGMGGLFSGLEVPRLGVAWLILMMPFLVDATLTLLLRLQAGHSPLKAHRDHTYQRAVQRLGSPLPVTLGLALLHLLWQFPLALTVVQTGLFIPIVVIFSAIPSVLLLAYYRRAA